MKILLDTNIVLTYLSGREDPYSDACEQIMLLLAEGKAEGFIAFHTLSTVWYVTRKVPDLTRRAYIRSLCTLLTVVGADNSTILASLEKADFTDFEDALQDCCAQTAGVDCIITANIKDFEHHSVIPAKTPDAFLTDISL